MTCSYSSRVNGILAVSSEPTVRFSVPSVLVPSPLNRIWPETVVSRASTDIAITSFSPALKRPRLFALSFFSDSAYIMYEWLMSVNPFGALSVAVNHEKPCSSGLVSVISTRVHPSASHALETVSVMRKNLSFCDKVFLRPCGDTSNQLLLMFPPWFGRYERSLAARCVVVLALTRRLRNARRNKSHGAAA